MFSGAFTDCTSFAIVVLSPTPRGKAVRAVLAIRAQAFDGAFEPRFGRADGHQENIGARVDDQRHAERLRRVAKRLDIRCLQVECDVGGFVAASDVFEI
jgi:hypothetical protein